MCSFIFRLRDLNFERLARAFGLFRVLKMTGSGLGAGRGRLTHPVMDFCADDAQLPRMPELRDMRVTIPVDPFNVRVWRLALLVADPHG